MNPVVGNIPPELIERAIKYQITEPPLVMRFTKGYNIVQEYSAQEVVDRIHALLRAVSGITYTYFRFKFTICVENKCCEINIYRNMGEFKKPKDTGCFSIEMISDDGKPQFLIEHEDFTRYFNQLFNYIINNYSAESPESFSADDLNDGPDYPEEEEDEDELQRQRDEQEEIIDHYYGRYTA
jgi:hypothetical protein